MHTEIYRAVAKASPPNPLSSGEGEPILLKINELRGCESPLSAGEGVGGEAFHAARSNDLNIQNK
jgi:hypothetical protein